MEPLISKATILLLTLILSLILLISTLIYFLLKYLLSTNTNQYDDDDVSVTAVQGRLQQLFLLHDCGVDQRFIDALPRFKYGAITARGDDEFDCAVCLCQLEKEDTLRLLPDCGHAFHVGCIDTWLLAHSTCPLCRSNILAECVNTDSSLSRDSSVDESVAEERVVTVKLGSFRKVDAGEGEEEGVDKRRCFSMGSYEYVTSESSSLRVAVTTTSSKRRMCDCRSRNAVSFRMPMRRQSEQREADAEAARSWDGSGAVGVESRIGNKFNFQIQM